jgi:hypothetical protein
MVRQTD